MFGCHENVLPLLPVKDCEEADRVFKAREGPWGEGGGGCTHGCVCVCVCVELEDVEVEHVCSAATRMSCSSGRTTRASTRAP